MKYYPHAIVGVVCLVLGCVIGGAFVAASKAAKVVDMVDNSKERVAEDYNAASNAVREKGGDVMENVDAEELGKGATEGVKELSKGAKEGLKDIGRSWKEKLKGKSKETETPSDETPLEEVFNQIEEALNDGDIEKAKEIINIGREVIKVKKQT